jgi:hypothetical protein
VIVIAGVIAIVFARSGSSNNLPPQASDHWHAALGVYMCDHWQGDGNWAWPTQTATGEPARAGTNLYAGMHSHGDGLIHIEPQTSDEMGKNATLGTYFKFGGWKLNSSEVTFVGATEKNGDKCGSKDGVLRWEVNGTEHTGNPASYKINDGDWIAIAFVPKDTKLSSIGKPPSIANLETVQSGGTVATSPPGVTGPPTASTTTSSAPSATTTSAGASPAP